MNVLNSQDEQSFASATRARMLGMGFEGLESFSNSLIRLHSALNDLKSLCDDSTRRRVDRLVRQVDSFEPSVTMIGQIKSGKTSLVNGMIGSPELLPADVNPWTSVVTSLHLHPENSGVTQRASFQFFDTEEWDRLISGGGRIGELASRTGADAELEKIKQQIAEMREKSRERLGRRFEMLLGQKRDYGYFDKSLIERYVCLGEGIDDEGSLGGSDDQGRFADVTKSADLTMPRASMPMRLCLRDTPGVNDTFMMREQVTIRAIRDSRICVVVLTAHQALSSTDMAIIRLISQVKSRDVIIFVNRIDELANPAQQVPQIRASVEETLKKHKGPEGAHLIFGSALWANAALCGTAKDLPTPYANALENWSVSRPDLDDKTWGGGDGPDAMAWRLSGVPELQEAIADRIIHGNGLALLQKVGASGHNLASGIAAAGAIGDDASDNASSAKLDKEEARGRMMRIAQECAAELDQLLTETIDSTRDRMKRAQDSFLGRATSELIRHLEDYGEQTPWTYDPAGLRLLLNASHKVFARKTKTSFDGVAQKAAGQISQLYLDRFGNAGKNLHIIAPQSPHVPPPVSLGRTIALDLSASWWKRWWVQRRGYSAYADSFRHLIQTETDPVVAELIDDLAASVKQEASAILDAFIDEQLVVFDRCEEMETAGSGELQGILEQHGTSSSQERIEKTITTLSEYAVS